MMPVHQASSPTAEPHSSFVEGTRRTLYGTSFLLLGPDRQVGSNHRQGSSPQQVGPLPTTTSCPQTPRCKRVKSEWHGLPSPDTPASFTELITWNFAARGNDNEFDQSKAPSDDPLNIECTPLRPSVSPLTSRSSSVYTSGEVTGSLDNVHTAMTVSIESNTKRAPELETSLCPSTRRSARIRSKTKSTESKPGIPPSKLTVKRTNVTRQQKKNLITSAEPSSSPFDVVIRRQIELPAVMSLDWELQYPLSGSTHPSYPWPTADPRLVFHAHFVPLRNGLPEVSLVPDLSLPMGWRQASWSGLHPVVFDPYQQIFKLTPIGPLPLTCEELHQGGLQDYVPGGKLHPESDLLPMMHEFSDGSDSDVFNFDGVDWTLPWANLANISSADPCNITSNHKAPSDPHTHSASAIIHTRHYMELRDCPDGIIDLEEGWRWLIEHEGGSYTSFTPRPGKVWRGTGVYRTGRKFKAPIASLMANTMVEDEKTNSERYLLNQDTRKFDAFKSVATPVHVNIALLQDVELTLVELLSYFPCHYQWRKGGDRLIKSGMSASEITNLINMLRYLPGVSSCSRNSVDEHVFWSKLEDGNRVKVSRSESEIFSYTAEGWTYFVWELTDYPLLALAHGLLELPLGSDAGPLTHLIKWCREHERFKAMLSDVPSLLKEANISLLVESVNGANSDQEVIAKHGDAIKKDRLRVLKEICDAKEQRELKTLTQKVSRKRRLE